jgi:hypothetical protein
VNGTDPQTAVVENVFHRESRSLLQYVADAFPWARPEDEGTLAQIRTMVDEERQGAAELARYLTRRRHVAPYPGQFPMAYTNVNFISLAHWLPLLTDEERRSLAALERDVDGLTDPEGRALLTRLADTKRRHLGTLEALAAGRPAAPTPAPAAAPH